MCGLFNLSHSSREVGAYFDYAETAEFPPREFVAPSQPIAIVRHDENSCTQQRQFALVRWGFVPGWAKEIRPGKPLINARAETVAEKPSFRHAIRRRRCLVPASGFYEWQADTSGKKQAWWIPKHDGGLIAFAGIWEYWMGPDGSELETAAIITTDANQVLGQIYHRMPAVIESEDLGCWLDAVNTPLVEAVALLKPAPDDYFSPEKTEFKRAASRETEQEASSQLDLF